MRAATWRTYCPQWIRPHRAQSTSLIIVSIIHRHLRSRPSCSPFVAAPLGSSEAEGALQTGGASSSNHDPMSMNGNAQASSSAAMPSSADPGECDSVSSRHDIDDLTQQPVLSKGERKRQAEDVVEDVAEDGPPAKRAAVAVAAGNKENLPYPGEIEELDDLDWEHAAPTWAGEAIPRMPGKGVLCYLRNRYGFNDARNEVRCKIDGCKDTGRIKRGAMQSQLQGTEALPHQEVWTVWGSPSARNFFTTRHPTRTICDEKLR